MNNTKIDEAAKAVERKKLLGEILCEAWQGHKIEEMNTMGFIEKKFARSIQSAGISHEVLQILDAVDPNLQASFTDSWRIGSGIRTLTMLRTPKGTLFKKALEDRASVEVADIFLNHYSKQIGFEENAAKLWQKMKKWGNQLRKLLAPEGVTPRLFDTSIQKFPSKSPIQQAARLDTISRSSNVPVRL
jgi:hypothetical protein